MEVFDQVEFGGIGENSPKLKALYTVPEFARLCGVHRNAVDRLLKNAGVEFAGSGRGRRIPISEIEEKLPEVYRSVLLRQRDGF